VLRTKSITAGVVLVLLLAACGGKTASRSVATTTTAAPTQTTIVRPGHPPGAQDVSTTKAGQPFWATPNFYWFSGDPAQGGCGRPCWLPIYAHPSIDPGKSVTAGWPCEFYDVASISTGPFCASHTSPKGDRIRVISQTHGQMIHDQRPAFSDIWDKVVVPKNRITQNLGLTPAPHGTGYYAWAADLWLGNTGLH
jgi:hypothetical protein